MKSAGNSFSPVTRTVLFALICIFACCQSNTPPEQKETPKAEIVSYDTFPASNPVLAITGKSHEPDQKLNPYLSQKETKELDNCNKSKAVTYIFDCITAQFRKAPPPIQIGPMPEPNYSIQQALTDSIFITQCLGLTTFFSDPAEDLVYGFLKGKLVDRTPSYVLCLIMFANRDTYVYNLYSFTPEGKLISKKEFAGLVSDKYELYGFLKDRTTFEIYRNDFDYEGGKPFIKLRTHEKYVISSEGKFRLANEK